MIRFVTIKDISKYTNLAMTIPSLGEKWHFNALNTNKKSKFQLGEVFQTSILSMGPELDTWYKNESLSYNKRYLEIYQFDYDDYNSRWKTAFGCPKYIQENPISDFVKFWKLQF